ncbi:hypothetical protein V8G54_027858 [Vigna mungo]|uniref:Uncharacterized protein n=1 Tax=Vigna mungo TaxID=3915 RepID=A0AAQ3MR69_VIGMU
MVMEGRKVKEIVVQCFYAKSLMEGRYGPCRNVTTVFTFIVLLHGSTTILPALSAETISLSTTTITATPNFLETFSFVSSAISLIYSLFFFTYFFLQLPMVSVSPYFINAVRIYTEKSINKF